MDDVILETHWEQSITM